MIQPALFHQPAQWLTKLGGSEFRVMRLNDAPPSDCLLDHPAAAVAYLRPKLAESIIFRPDVENFIVIHLNVHKKPIGFEIITQGTLDTLLVHPREVFKSAIVANSAAIILCHNHPSGNPAPSEADIKVTRDLRRAGELMKIEIADHIILGRDGTDQSFTSLREKGYFY